MKKRLVRILTAVAVVIVALGIIYAIAVAISAAKLRRAYAELEKAGRPMRSADVIPPEIPDAENAALLYQSAALLLKAQPAPQKSEDQKDKDLLSYLGSLSTPLVDGTIEPNELVELEQWIGQDVVSQALSIVQQGAQRPGCRFEQNYNPLFAHNPSLLDLRGLTRLLDAKTRLEARAGRPANAWELAWVQLKLADALRQDPTLISQLVRMAMIRLSCDTIQTLCRSAAPDKQQSQALSELLLPLDDIQPVIHAIDGERLLMGEALFNTPKRQLWGELRGYVSENSMPDFFYWFLFHRITFRPSFLADHAAYLRIMNDYCGVIARPYSPDDAKEPGLGGHMTNILVPAMYRIKEIHLEDMARIRITLVGLALLQYRKAHGSFPPALDALGLKGLFDPFSDQPLRYQAEGNGFLLYSIGKDQKDNDGAAKQPKQKTDYDVVWQFPSGSK